MAILGKLEDYLEQSHVRYTHTIHPVAFTAQEVAEVENVPAHKVAKTVVFRDEDGFGIAVLPADRDVDLQELRFSLGVGHMLLATENELLKLFPDCELGAMPPFGNLYRLPVFVDDSLLEEDVIAMNAGTHRDVIHMSFEDYSRLVEPIVISFSKELECAGIARSAWD